MSEFDLFTDSCCDLDTETRRKHCIEYVAMNVTYDNKELPASLDWDIYSPQEFYGIMKKGTRIMTTQVPAATFLSAFENSLKNKKDVLYIGCSSALSGSVNTAKVVADELNSKYDNKIYCVDALNSCGGEGLMVLDAADMRDGGKNAEEIVSCLEENKLKYLQFCAVADLTYLKRAGRVKASTAFFGNLFGVKPILISNRAGENLAFKKAKGRKNSLDEIFNLAKENIINPEEQTVFVMHADCLADAEYLKGRIENELHPKDVYVNFIGPIIGASAGPDTIAIYCKGKEVQV